MVDLAIEGLESVRLPCSWVILFPALAVTVYARRRTPLAIGAFVGVAAVLAWVRFAGWWFAVPTGVVQVLLGVLVAIATAFAWRADRSEADAVLAGLAALIAVWAWIPCVGPRLGTLLGDVRSEPAANFAGTVAYVVGLLAPFIMIAALGVLVPEAAARTNRRAVVAVGAIGLLVFAGLLATTLLDDVSSELARRSTF
jgi:cytochrome c biogenesis protein CcdA